MKVTGSCHCGRITYEAVIEADNVGICHCTDCQTLSGSAFRTVAFSQPGQFTLITGTLQKYIKIGESGNERIQSFCSNCGSPIYSAPTSGNDVQYSIRVGTIKERAELVPKFQIWHQSAQNWVSSITDIASKEKQ